MTTNAPVWLEYVTLENWPTQTVHSKSLHYTLLLCQRWRTIPQENKTALEQEHIYRGVYPPDCLCVSFMDQADPTSNLRNWVESLIALTGFPIQALRLPNSSPPELLEWSYEGTNLSLEKRLKVDEVHLYQGLAMISGQPPELARFYILLARRGTLAWRVTLSLASACLPGCDIEMVTANDHVRAGATFGTIHLL